MKRAMKKILAALLILSMCMSTINIKAMAEEEAVDTQTEQGEGETQDSEDKDVSQPSEEESDTRTGEEGSGAQPGRDEDDTQSGEGEDGSQTGEDEGSTQPGEDEDVSQPNEEEPGSEDNSTAEETDGWDGVTTESVYEGENFKVTFALSGYWNGGYNANVKVENTGKTVIGTGRWSLTMPERFPTYGMR